MTTIKHPEKKDKPKKPNSRSKKSPEIIKRILISISIDRLSLRKACAKEAISDGTFLLWVLEDDDLAEQYARCMNIRNERMAEEILDIADDITEDNILDENGHRRANNEWINRSRLRVDTRKWLLSKLLPKKFGDKIEVDNKGAVGLNINVVQYSHNLKNEHNNS